MALDGSGDPLLDQSEPCEIEESNPDPQSPSWWEVIAPSLQIRLGQLSSLLASYGNYALAPLAATGHLIQNNPKSATTVAFVAASALYNKLNPEARLEPAPLPDNPALAQERIDDAIEDILDTPIVSNGTLVSDVILGLMYKSTEHELLQDAELIEEVAVVLGRNSTKSPDKTFATLIESALYETHTKSSSAQFKVVNLGSSQEVKLHALTAREDTAIKPSVNEDVLQPSNADEHSPTPEEQVTRYLNTMEEQQIYNIDADEDIDNEPPVDTQIDAAIHAIHLLRKRRDVVWTDASRANGDSDLATRYAATLLQAAETTDQGANLKIVIPVHSTFGRCWLNFVKAFNNPFFQEWATKNGLDLSTVTVDAEHSSISGVVRGVRTRFVLDDNFGWANVAAPLLTAAKVLDPLAQGVKYDGKSSNAPFALVADFYGETRPLTKTDAQNRVNDLGKTKSFAEIKADDPLRPLALRSEDVLDSQSKRVGDVYNLHALVTALNAEVRDKTDDALIDLDTVWVAVHPDSTFYRKYPTEAKTLVSGRRLISTSGWTEPKTRADAVNLINALSFGIVEKPRGNYWGACDYPRPLTPTQQNTIISLTSGFLSTTGYKGLLDYLLRDQDIANVPQETAINLALDSDQGKIFGKALETALSAIPTATSAAEWLMAALVLDLNPIEGSKRNHVAGYDLTQKANWGLKPSAVVAKLETHILASGKASANVAPFAARHLLANIGPEFLVRNLPDNLVCGTHTWAMLRIAVNRLEQLSSGSTSRMTFEQVMGYGDTSPISVGQEVAVEMASVNPLVDWAIVYGVIVKANNDIYSKPQLAIAREKFQEVREELGRAQHFLSAPTPTRKAIALAELTRVFGEGIPFEAFALYKKSIPHSVRKMQYSMLDLYMAGTLTPGTYNSIDAKVNIRAIEHKITELKNVASIFEEEFTGFFDGLIAGSKSVFKHLISQLPLQDRQSLEFGKNTFYTLRSEVDFNLDLPQLLEQKESAKGRHGLLIRSEHQGAINYYEVFPSAIKISKRTDLPNELILGGRFTVPLDTGEERAERGRPYPFDWEAYKTGTTPRDGITSDVIIEQIIPGTRQSRTYPQHFDFNTVPNPFSPNSNINNMASMAVNQHFITGREALHDLAKGSTASEEEAILKDKVADFFLGLVPFKSCIENIVKGDGNNAALDCTLDVAGFVIPGAKAVGKGAQVIKSSGKFLPKILKLTMISGRTLVTSSNPFDGIADVAKFGKNAVCKLDSLAYKAAEKGVDQIKNLYGCTKAVDSTDLLKHADIAEGTCDAVAVAGQTTKVTATFKDGKWFAFDVSKNSPYGPPLENFKLDSSVSLESTTFGDGTTAYTNSKLFNESPRTIRRLSGVDVVVGDTVFRFDPSKPGVLDDITSPPYSSAEGFNVVCSRGSKGKRSPNSCFSKIIEAGKTIDYNRAQSIAHKRLFPSRRATSQVRQVIHERKLFNVVNKGAGDLLVRSPLTEPLQFRLRTTGAIIEDMHFGLPKKQIDAVLNLETRIVRIDGIVHGVDDQRDVRGILLDLDFQGTGSKTYLVAETDTGLYYYCEYDPAAVTGVQFTRIDTLYRDSLASNLIKAHDKIKDRYIAAGGSIHNEFIALPPLDEIYNDLILKKWFYRSKNK